MPVGGLIGRVGNSRPFPIGSNSQPITMPENGRLYLGINDEEVGHSAVGAHAEGNVQRTTVGMTGDAIAARSARLARPRGDAGADGQA